MNHKSRKPILVLISSINLFESFGQVPGLNSNLFIESRYYSSVFEFKSDLSSYNLDQIYVFVIEDGISSNGFNLEWLAGGLKTFLPKSRVYKIRFIEEINDIETIELLINYSYFKSKVSQPFDYIFLNKIKSTTVLNGIKIWQ